MHKQKFFKIKSSVSFIFIALYMVTLGSCHSSKSVTGHAMNNKQELYQYKWYLSELDGKPYTFVGSNNELSWLLFTEENPVKVSGFTGCNRLMGSVQINDENSMKFLPVASTKMYCAGNEEAAILKALSSVTNYHIADTQLVLKNGNTIVARFNGVSPAMERLSGKWELNYITGPKIAFDALYPEKKPTITFNFSAKEIMGNTSCNGFSSKYSINGNQIYFAEGIRTMMFCAGGGEETFLNMLKKVNRYSLADNALTFMMDDIAVMRFVKKASE